MTGPVFFFRLVTSHFEIFLGRKMIKGFNSDILYKGLTIHVQTEDWGRTNPFFVSQVFRSGEVLKTIKVPYTKVLPRGTQTDEKTIRIALETQHHSVLDLLLSGHLI